MKVVAFNGSPRPQGNTYMALRTVADVLEKHGIEVEIIQVGDKPIHGCAACNACVKNRDGRCALPDDGVNEWIRKMAEADGILLGTPVYFAGLSGTMKSFLDRAFFVAGNNGSLRHKVGAAVAAVRRTGGIPAMDALNHYIAYSEMVMPTSNYWNVVHGMKPGEVEQDAEGIQCMQVLGENMAWLMKLMEYGKDAVPAPEAVRKRFTNFIR